MLLQHHLTCDVARTWVKPVFNCIKRMSLSVLLQCLGGGRPPGFTAQFPQSVLVVCVETSREWTDGQRPSTPGSKPLDSRPLLAPLSFKSAVPSGSHMCNLSRPGS